MYRRLYANYTKVRFISKHIALSVLFPRRKMRILFSVKPAWEKNISKGFRFTNHRLKFNLLTDKNLKKCDLVVPLTMDDLKSLAQRRHLVGNNAIPIPSLEAINICDNKYLFYKKLQQEGFEDALPEVGTNLPYKYLLKKKIAEDSDDIYIISNKEDELKYKDLINSPDYFCQKIIEGQTEYATHIIFRNNEVASYINVEYFFSANMSIKGKDKIICKTICDCPHLELFSAMLASIGFEGLCCFNYKEVDGKPFVFEINPRFGGSLSSFFFSFMKVLDTKNVVPQLKIDMRMK